MRVVVVVVLLLLSSACPSEPVAVEVMQLPTPTAPTPVPAPAVPTPPPEIIPELALASTATLSAAQHDAIALALVPALAHAEACMGGIFGTVFVDVAFAPGGAVKEARFSTKNQLPIGEILKDTCFLPELRKAAIPPTKAGVTASFPVRRLPSNEMLQGAAHDIANDGSNVIVR